MQVSGKEWESSGYISKLINSQRILIYVVKAIKIYLSRTDNQRFECYVFWAYMTSQVN